MCCENRVCLRSRNSQFHIAVTGCQEVYVLSQLAAQLVEHQRGGDGNVKTMLRPKLLDLQASVAIVDDALLYALHLVTEDDGQRAMAIRPELP